jgi:putative tricarboxylic transport membrane protein
MKRIVADFWLAVCVIVGASAYLHADAQLPVMRIADPLGPKAFPALIGIGLIVASLMLLLECWRKRRALLAEAKPAEASAPFEKKQTLVLLAMVGWTAVYYACFERLGYLISTAVFLFGLLCYFNRKRHVMNLAVAIGFTIVIDVIFSKLLNVPMPTGFLSI